MKLFVAGITYRTTEDDLRRMFEKYGNVTEASLATDRETGKSKGFGFITMPISTQAEMAIRALHGSTVDGRTLNVEPSLNQNDSRSRTARR